MVILGYMNGDIEIVRAEKICIVKEMGVVRVERSGCKGYEIALQNIKAVVVDGMTIYKTAG